MNDDDIKKLNQALNSLPNKTDLENALGMLTDSEKPRRFGVIQFDDEAKAISTCEQLNAIMGVESHQTRGRVMINFEPAFAQVAQDEVTARATENGWNVSWLDTVPKP